MTGKLSERAMLVTLHLSAYTGMMTDKEVTDAAHEQFNAQADAGRYGKRLIAQKFLTPVSNAHQNARKVHRLLTLPWEDDGTRILTTAGYTLYQAKMKECHHKIDAEVKTFVKGLPEYIEEARKRLGSMFNEGDYPDQEELADKFGFDIEVKSLPQAADFRAKLTDDQAKNIVKDIEKRSNKRIEIAMNDVYDRVLEMVKTLTGKLREYKAPQNGEKGTGIIRDSQLYNIYKFAEEMMPILNVTGDERMEDLRKSLLTDLMVHSPEILRADSNARKQTISAADKILKKVKGYMA